jgi:tRNA modification GTPase
MKLSESAAETVDCADLAAFELRAALDALGSVTGEVTTDDLLGRVFANFCIGK